MVRLKFKNKLQIDILPLSLIYYFSYYLFEFPQPAYASFYFYTFSLIFGKNHHLVGH